MSGWGEKNADDYKIASSDVGAAKTLGAQSHSLRKLDGETVSHSAASKAALARAEAPASATPLKGEADEALTQQSPLMVGVSFLIVFVIGIAIGFVMFKGPGSDLQQKINAACSAELFAGAEIKAIAELCGATPGWKAAALETPKPDQAEESAKPHDARAGEEEQIK